MDADIVIGQPDFTSSTAGTSQSRINNPTDVVSDGQGLFVSEEANHRVLIWNRIPTGNFEPADVVVGQPDFTTGSAGTTQIKMQFPAGIFYDGKRLFVADTFNHRVLIYNSLPTSNNAPADIVLGQSVFTAGNANQGGAAAANTLNRPRHVFSNGRQLFILDGRNHRILIYNSIPTQSNAPANLVLGQPDFASTTSGTGPNRLNDPYGIYSDGQRLFIADATNNRVLIYNSIPTKNFASADVVIGQRDFASSTADVSTMSNPLRVVSDGKRLFVGDANNSRILVWNSIPTKNGTAPDLVLGQPDLNSSGAATAKNRMSSPYTPFSDGRRLFVSDFNNNRVLIFNLGSSGIELGPQFEQGKAVLGKVFWDHNGNGVQDSDERTAHSGQEKKEDKEGLNVERSTLSAETGIEGVKVASDTGIYAITDEDGKYHFPYIETGQHVLKIDESTLPEGSTITTESPRKIIVTPGILSKVSFGVKPSTVIAGPAEFHLGGESIPPNTNNPAGNTGTASSAPAAPPPNDVLLKVSISQDPALLKPKLSVSAQQEPLQSSGGQARTQSAGGYGKIVFTIDCNYFLFIEKSELILYDKDLKPFRTIPLPNPLPHRYIIDLKDLPSYTDTLHYQLSVFDKSGKEDRTGVGKINLV